MGFLCGILIATNRLVPLVLEVRWPMEKMKLLERRILPIKRNRFFFHSEYSRILVSKRHFLPQWIRLEELLSKRWMINYHPEVLATARWTKSIDTSTVYIYMYISTFSLAGGVWGSSSYRSFTPHTIRTVRPWKWMDGFCRPSGFLLRPSIFSGAILNLGGLKKSYIKN